MTWLEEILNPVELDEEVEAGNVRRQQHPHFPELFIYNYTEQCAYNRHWTDVTRTTRGLIVNSDNGEVLARPFPKFFNWDEKEAPRILDDQVMWHWDNKYDGSLGILYYEPTGRPAIATRGSFASEQAILATRLLHESGRAWQFAEYIDSGYTPLFEICGPSNPIVLRYEEDFLQPLGYMHIATGMFVPPGGAESRTMRDLLGDLSRSDAEGWVVWLSSNSAVKIKQADYIALHRLVTGLSKKEVWRQLRAGTYAGYVAQLPDEIQKEAEVWADELREEFSKVHVEATVQAYTLENAHLASRKEQAFWIRENVGVAERGLVFSLLDGKDITDSIWRMLEPSGVTA